MPLDPLHARVLDAVAADTQAMLDLLQTLVRTPSVGGTRGESDLQQRLAQDFAAFGLETDLWPLPLAELAAEPDFPGRRSRSRDCVWSRRTAQRPG